MRVGQQVRSRWEPRVRDQHRERHEAVTVDAVIASLGTALVEVVRVGRPPATIKAVRVMTRGETGDDVIALAPGVTPEIAIATADAAGHPAVVIDRPETVGDIADAELGRPGLTVLRRAAGVDWLELADAARHLMRSKSPEVAAQTPATPRVGDLPALAESLATMLGGPVIIEDVDFRVLSFSTAREEVDRGRDTAILGGRIPDQWLEHLERVGALETLLNSDRVVDVSDGPFNARRRLLKAIRFDRRPLGILWVAEGSKPLPDDVAERIDHAADLTAPHLLHHLNDSHDRLAAQRWQLRRLIETADLGRADLEDIGLAPADGYAVLALRSRAEAVDGLMPRLVGAVDLYCQSYRWRVASIAFGATVYSVLALAPHRGHRELDSLARSFADHVRQSQHIDPVMALAGPDADVRRVPRLRRQTEEVLDVLLDGGTRWPSVLHHRDALPAIGLRQVAALAREHGFADFHKLARLREHDGRADGFYLTTLAEYLRSGGDVSSTARRLGLHPTTLRYRLRRLAAISGLDLDDPVERLYCAITLLDPALVR